MTWSLCPARRPKDSTRAKVLLSNSNAISHDLRCRRCDVYHTFLFGKFSVESERRAKPYQGSMQRKGAPFRVDQIPVAAALAGSSYDGAWNLFFVMHRDIRDPTYNLRSTKGATANPRSPTANGRFAPTAAIRNQMEWRCLLLTQPRTSGGCGTMSEKCHKATSTRS
jgi:hypothetical protein